MAAEDGGMDGEERMGGLMAEWKNMWTCDGRGREDRVEDERMMGRHE